MYDCLRYSGEPKKFRHFLSLARDIFPIRSCVSTFYGDHRPRVSTRVNHMTFFNSHVYTSSRIRRKDGQNMYWNSSTKYVQVYSTNACTTWYYFLPVNNRCKVHQVRVYSINSYFHPEIMLNAVFDPVSCWTLSMRSAVLLLLLRFLHYY